MQLRELAELGHHVVAPTRGSGRGLGGLGGLGVGDGLRGRLVHGGLLRLRLVRLLLGLVVVLLLLAVLHPARDGGRRAGDDRGPRRHADEAGTAHSSEWHVFLLQSAFSARNALTMGAGMPSRAMTTPPASYSVAAKDLAHSSSTTRIAADLPGSRLSAR